jgi:hypothetical protein
MVKKTRIRKRVCSGLQLNTHNYPVRFPQEPEHNIIEEIQETEQEDYSSQQVAVILDSEDDQPELGVCDNDEDEGNEPEYLDMSGWEPD